MKIQFDISTQANVQLAQKILDAIEQCLIPGNDASEAAKVFGSAAPLVAAPYTAAAEPPPTAPAALPDSMLQSQAVFAPAAPIATPPAPPAAPTVVTSSAPALVVDSAGMPWDERIHAGTKQKIANGTWRKKKGVDQALVDQVEAELRGFAALAAPAPAPVAPPAPAPAAPAPAAPPAPVAPAPSGLSPFTQLVVDTSKAINKKTLTPADVVTACNQVGLANMGELNAHPELIDTVRALLADKL